MQILHPFFILINWSASKQSQYYYENNNKLADVRKAPSLTGRKWKIVKHQLLWIWTLTVFAFKLIDIRPFPNSPISFTVWLNSYNIENLRTVGVTYIQFALSIAIAHFVLISSIFFFSALRLSLSFVLHITFKLISIGVNER